MNLHRSSDSRRNFLKSLATTAIAPLVVPASALGRDRTVAPSERVVMGFLGVGGRGTAELKAFLINPDVQVLAVCDLFHDRREAARQLVDDHYDKTVCTAYNDFREVLARADIDAVAINTQDSWHVPLALAACRSKKDLHVAKPLGYCITEQRLLCREIEKHGTVFQFATQQRHGWTFQLAVESARSGKLGELHTIEVGSPAGEFLENQPEMPVPEGFDYDMWLGPAPWKPYTEKRCLTPWWWWIADYTFSGFVAGWGIHHIDIAQWGADADNTGPVEIEGTGVFPKSGLCDTATAWNVRMRYGNGIQLIYTDDRKENNRNKCRHGVKFIGSEGWVHVDRDRISAEPAALLEGRETNWSIPYVPQEGVRNFLDCFKTRNPATCTAEIAHRSTTVCHLAQIALLLQRPLRWNPHDERFIDDDEADTYLYRTLREPWSL